MPALLARSAEATGAPGAYPLLLHLQRRGPMPRSLELSTTLVEEGAAIAALDSPPVSTGIIVVGGGQAGLSVGYHLKQLGVDDFLILDGEARIGDAWRKRWDSLKLFTPA